MPALFPSFERTVDSPQVDLLNALSALHFGGKYSDLTVRCRSREWAVHRAIVCSRSGFFDGACSFRGSDSRVIDLSDDDEDAVAQMIYFLYHLDYDVAPVSKPVTIFRHRAQSDARRKPPKKLDLALVEDPLLAAAGFYKSQESVASSSRPTTPTSPTEEKLGKAPRSPIKTRMRSPSLRSDTGSDCDMMDEDIYMDADLEFDDAHLLLHTRVYAMAEKYDIPALKAVAKFKFEAAMACHYDSPEFADAIEEVYTSTIDSDRGLRDIVIDAFKAHPQLARTSDVYAVIKDNPSLALELFKVERGIPPTA